MYLNTTVNVNNDFYLHTHDKKRDTLTTPFKFIYKSHLLSAFFYMKLYYVENVSYFPEFFFFFDGFSGIQFQTSGIVIVIVIN